MNQALNTTLTWSNTLLDGRRVSLAEAEQAIAALGDEWRLPTVDELQTILDRSRFKPAIDTEKFPDTQSEPYWTSTPCAWRSNGRWVVLFDLGFVDGYGGGLSACVRACRAHRRDGASKNHFRRGQSDRNQCPDSARCSEIQNGVPQRTHWHQPKGS